ncbi:MAG TPA: malto-oligosyltrehalose trehalohydrolase [Candidatus Angelobacter sp.]|nr:malto-oligosyltrehalose trehalohydrolase [Candidatus Angelobacter sp.]
MAPFSTYVNSRTLGKAPAVPLGASLAGDACEFRLWAPAAKTVTLRLMNEHGQQDLPMQYAGDNLFYLQAFARAGNRYFYIVDQNKPVPDPVSRLLPEGVHGPTEIIGPEKFSWTGTEAGWRGLSLRDYVIYELHIGTFTPEGTFDAAIGKLPYLKKLGVTVIEIMPVAAFPGTRNWGYDGVSPYAVQASYGGPDGLKRLVNAAHKMGLGVILDVVYNHLGNEGNYLRLFGPYFTNKHKTPWGEAVNFDQPGCEGVRRYFVENALYWIREYHMDGLRLDAVQTIRDESGKHILAEIAEDVAALAAELGREVCVIAETDENDEKLVRSAGSGGFGLDAIWSDDFHHAIHAFFTSEREGYYQDFGHPSEIARALQDGFVFQGGPFKFWDGRPRGTSSSNMPTPAHVICIQNHDQVGNRARGERLTALVPRGTRMLAAALLLLAPETPLLFMGQEYDEPGPFQFFTDYGDPALQKAVREGRQQEFKDFDFAGGHVPDPQAPATFQRSKLNWQLTQGENSMLDWYTALLALRGKYIIGSERTCKAELIDGVIHMQLPREGPVLKVFARIQGSAELPVLSGTWEKALAREEDGFAVSVWVEGLDVR